MYFFRYEAEWQAIHAACVKAGREERALHDKAVQDAGQEFFSTLWKKYNKKVGNDQACLKDSCRG